MGDNLKVLHLSAEKTWRGGEQQIAYLIEELSSLGVDNRVAVCRNSAFESYCKQKQIPFLSLPFRNTFDIQTALAVKKICRTSGIDIVQMHSPKAHGIGVMSAVLGNQTPLILSRRVDFTPKQNMVTRWRYNHPSIKRIVGVSDKITAIMKAYVSDPGKCVTIHSGIDLRKFSKQPAVNILRKEYDIPENYSIIGNVSALEGHKDYPTFIRTILQLVRMKAAVKAFIIGAGSLRPELEAMTRAAGLENEIFFTGFRPDIATVLPCLDVFLMTSETEGLGTTVLDAFAAKVPVVATSAGGIPEMVRHESTGLLSPVKDHISLAGNILRLLEDTTLKEQIVKNAWETVQQFSKRATAEKTLALYNAVIRQRTDS